jgi:CheY-like chemotaxis protein
MGGLVARTLGGMVEIETNVGRDLWPALADSGQVENAILNLAINARDAMPKGGTLTIECLNMTVDENTVEPGFKMSSCDYAVLSVSDTGVGMPEDVRARAFEPFFTTKDVGEGSGLGLSMIYGFVKQSGGYVTIDSTEGHGTTVKIFLPLAWEAAARTNLANIEEVPRGQQEVVLVIEDSVDVQMMVVAMLEGLGYRVVTASTAIEARSALEQEKRVDVILSDIVLPGGVSGLEFSEEARARDPDLLFIFMSGYSADAARNIGRLRPDDVFLNKPFTREKLAKALKEALN